MTRKTKDLIIGTCIILATIALFALACHMTKDKCRKVLPDGTVSETFDCPGHD